MGYLLSPSGGTPSSYTEFDTRKITPSPLQKLAPAPGPRRDLGWEEEKLPGNLWFETMQTAGSLHIYMLEGTCNFRLHKA